MPYHDYEFLGPKMRFRRQSNDEVEASAEFFSTLRALLGAVPLPRARRTMAWRP